MTISDKTFIRKLLNSSLLIQVCKLFTELEPEPEVKENLFKLVTVAAEFVVEPEDRSHRTRIGQT